MKPKILQASEMYQGKVFSLIEQQVKLPNGTLIKVETIRHPGAAAIVPMIDKSHIVLIRQYRYAVGDWIWEIPAGTLSPGEDPKDCARRELSEETAYEAGSLEKIGEIYPVPGYSDDCVHIFLATDLKPKSQHLEEDEILQVKKVPVNKALEMIKKGEIKDAKTIIGIFLLNSMMAEHGDDIK
jgi:ADP-ribose pyrophosphatase